MTSLTLTEERLREELVGSHQRLLAGELEPRLLKTLQERFPQTYRTAFVIEQIPEQTETLYTILLGGEDIARVEVPRAADDPVLCQHTTVREYAASAGKLTRPERRRLEMAMKLVDETAR